MHRANAILDAVVAAVTDLATTGDNVERTRGYPKHDVPAITVRLGEIQPIGERSNAFLDNHVDVETIYHVAGSDEDLDAQLLQIDAEVYAAIMADRTLGGAAMDADPQNLAPTSGFESEIPTASAIRRWRFRLRHGITNTETL